MSKSIKVAALQFETGTNINQNLSKVLSMIDAGAKHGSELLVLPEFCNHLSWYDSTEHAFEVSVDEDGDFVKSIQDRARAHRVYVVANLTTRRPERKATITSYLIGPDGKKLAVVDKQTLMGQENDYFVRSKSVTPVVKSKIGNIGIYICRDGVTMEAPRSLAVRGAQIMCISLNSFALDEAELHIPSRAPENKVFVISANKVGPLIPLDKIDAVSQKLGVRKELLYGAGESQVIDPLGRLLVKGSRDQEEVVTAEIDLSMANVKEQPDGTHIFNTRRPKLYKSVAKEFLEPIDHNSADEINAGVWQLGEQGETDLDKLLKAVKERSGEMDLLVLPELFCYTKNDLGDIDKASLQFSDWVRNLQQCCKGTELHICTSLIKKIDGGYQHVGVLVNESGLVFEQPQLHAEKSKPWMQLGEDILSIDLPWGKFGIMVGNDSIYPEVAKVLAIKGVDVIGVPFEAKEPWEIDLGLVDRSAENRVCLVAATRKKSFGGSLIITQWRDFQIFTPWKDHEFEGRINSPRVYRMEEETGLLIKAIHPSTARYKVMSKNTDLIKGRPWFLSAVIAKPTEELEDQNYFIIED